jgi:hypothetical protein
MVVRPGVAAVPDEEPVACLETLADVARQQAQAAYLTTTPRRPPCVFVENPRDDAVSGRVLAVRDTGTGTCWYWSGWAERIAPAASRAAVAAAIIRAVARGGNGTG